MTAGRCCGGQCPCAETAAADGILNVDKPRGETSYRVVARVKRLSGARRVGHAGTLDPDATGVLPVCLGRATRVTRFLMDATKTYRAEIELGTVTDTCDATGKVTRRGDPSGVRREDVEAALAGFRGIIRQTPPMYSAVKHQGRRLYELAREGVEVERKSRPAVIHRLDLLRWQPPVATVEIECGKGTYIRSLAYDLGEKLGCGAHLKSLVRTRYGPFHISRAVSVSQLEEAFRSGYWEHFLHPADSVLQHWKAVLVSDDTAAKLRNGAAVALEEGEETGAGGEAKRRCRAYTQDGRFLGVLRHDPETGRWQPEKIFQQGKDAPDGQTDTGQRAVKE